MKKKLLVTVFAIVVTLGFAKPEATHADAVIPKITSIQPINYIALNN